MNMAYAGHRDWSETFYQDLRDLVESSFPKVCPTCGMVYPTKEAFVEKTRPVRDRALEDRSGLFAMDREDTGTAVGLFRNCVCGTTIMADFHDRRDTSEAGHRRRRRFSALMDMLGQKGVPREIARRELLRVLHGRNSSLIDELLGKVNMVG